MGKSISTSKGQSLEVMLNALLDFENQIIEEQNPYSGRGMSNWMSELFNFYCYEEKDAVTFFSDYLGITSRWKNFKSYVEQLMLCQNLDEAILFVASGKDKYSDAFY